LTETLQGLAQQYLSGLRHYLDGEGEAALQSAYEVGRKAIADGLGGLEMLAIHQRCVAEALRNVRSSDRAAQITDLACNFLAESLSPFEMALRGFREQVARAQSEASQRFAFLAEIGSLLVASLDCETTLSAVARRIVPYLADGCWIFLTEPDGRIRLLCSEYSDRRTASHSGSSVVDPPPVFARTLREGQGQILSEMPEAWSGAFPGPHFQSMMLTPMLTQGRAQGLIVFGAADASRYNQDHLALAEDVARRCALAVDNTRLYRAMMAERDKAAEASRAKDDFLGILGHELRNPLVPILGWARNLKKDAVVAANPALSQGVETLERNARNILRLADDCLDLVRISERKVTLKQELLDLNQLVQACVEALRPAAQEKGLGVVANLSSSSLCVFGDRNRLEQVMNNLLINAIRYTDSGGLLSIRTSNVKGDAEVQVKDTGIGIAPEFLEQIFQPFRGGRKEWLTADAGLGLGLAIARQIVEMHGGAISAESPGVGAGSTFHLRLRLAPAEAAAPVAALPASQNLVPAGSLCILLIEDQQDVADLMRMDLEAVGYRVLTAADGKAGLDIAIRTVPDVIISDIKMPRMDGYELIRALRGTPGLASIPVIALTGLGMKKNVVAALAAGYDAHLNKPVEVSELSDVIQNLVAQRRARGAGS
jgi:signal transduction histidine kinase/ActR/RegA family two-component response regulator